jgi:O-glycosyl hydrolase
MSSKKYAAFKQFSRYVRPGAVRIDANFGNGKSSVGGASEYDTLNSVNVSAYYHDTDRVLTIVLLNLEASVQTVSLTIPASLGVAQMDVYRTSGTENFVTLADIFPLSGTQTITLPAYSVVTLTGRAYSVIPEPGAVGLGVLMAGVALVRRRGR